MVIYDNMDEHRGHCAMWNKPGIDILHVLIHMWDLTSGTHRSRENGGDQGLEGRAAQWYKIAVFQNEWVLEIYVMVAIVKNPLLFTQKLLREILNILTIKWYWWDDDYINWLGCGNHFTMCIHTKSPYCIPKIYAFYLPIISQGI
jgi:hypothetical protein